MISVIAVMLPLVFTNLVILFLLGGETATYLYPLLAAVEYISIADFFENLESVVYYCLVLGTAQWLNLSDYRPIVLPLGFLTLLFSFWSMPNQMKISEYTTITGFPFYSLLFQAAIPVLLLLIAFMRKRE